MIGMVYDLRSYLDPALWRSYPVDRGREQNGTTVAIYYVQIIRSIFHCRDGGGHQDIHLCLFDRFTSLAPFASIQRHRTGREWCGVGLPMVNTWYATAPVVCVD